MTKWQTAFRDALPEIKADFAYPLAAMSYFKLGGPAEIYADIFNLDDLQSVMAWVAQSNCPLTILGGASNVIVADEGISGLVIHLSADAIRADGQTMSAQAGAKTSLVVSHSVQQGLTGLEYFLGVPGSLGGAILNNAHYLQDLIGEHVARVQVVNHQGEVYWLSHDECDFGYDHSRFQQSQEIIWDVEFSLDRGTPEHSRQRIKEATEYRAQTQPLGEPSSGCIFQNVPNTPELKERFPQFAERAQVPAGFLIDQAGLKGERVGDVEVSHKHAAFMVNKGRGTARDLKQLISLVKERVLEKFGVHLQEEVFYLGE